jgi:hypothetical protein
VQIPYFCYIDNLQLHHTTEWLWYKRTVLHLESSASRLLLSTAAAPEDGNLHLGSPICSMGSVQRFFDEKNADGATREPCAGAGRPAAFTLHHPGFPRRL